MRSLVFVLSLAAAVTGCSVDHKCAALVGKGSISGPLEYDPSRGDTDPRALATFGTSPASAGLNAATTRFEGTFGNATFGFDLPTAIGVSRLEDLNGTVCDARCGKLYGTFELTKLVASCSDKACGHIEGTVNFEGHTRAVDEPQLRGLLNVEWHQEAVPAVCPSEATNAPSI